MTVTSSRLASCDLWDVTSPVLPPRSRLYHLAPIGVGTAHVESLTGYVARLAEAHNVTTVTLVEREVLPLLGKGHPFESRNSYLAAFWPRASQALNGTRKMAREWTQGLERLTMRSELRFLTLQPWAGVLPLAGLLRPTRAWCPVCYEEWHEAGQVVYEPLLWAVAVVMVCPLHRRHLTTRCPYPDCGLVLPLLGSRSRPGYCSRCKRWLGTSALPTPAGNGGLRDEETGWQMWVAESVGELLAAAPNLPAPPPRERIAQAVTVCVQQVAGGKVSVLARALGVSLPTACGWLHGESVPRIDLLLRMCDILDISALDFLTAEELDVRSIKTDRPWVHRPPPQARPLRRYDKAGQRQVLEQVLAGQEFPPPSMREVARRLEYRASGLSHRFPELCSAISARYTAYRAACAQENRLRLCAEVREAVRSLHAQGLYPSSNRVAALLRSPRHIQQPVARATWQETLRELGW